MTVNVVRGSRLPGLFLAAGAFVTTLGLSVVSGHLAAQTSLADPSLNAVLYLVEDSTLELFPSDEFGNVVGDASERVPVLAGVNNIEIPLSDPTFMSSFLQRLDPCECDTPVAISRLSLSAPFLEEQVPVSSWVFAGDIQGTRNEGTVLILRAAPGFLDPQVILYMDVDEFSDRAEQRAFWIVFIGTFALVGGIFLTMARWTNVRRDPASQRYTAPRRSLRPVGVPVLVLSGSSVLLMVGLVLQFSGAWSSGVTMDEPLHLEHLRHFFETGVYSSSAYGPATSLLGHFANVARGVETWGTVVATAEAYSVRHLTVAGLGALGVSAVAIISRVLLGSWQWAVVGAAMLVSIPLWVGHSMFNIKDIALAAGYTMVTGALVLAVSQVWTLRARISLGLLFLIAGCLVAIGTRPASAALVAVSSSVALVLWLAMVFPAWSSRTRWRWMAGLTVGIGAVTVAILAALGPILWESIERSTDFPWEGWNLYSGERVESRPGVLALAGVTASYLPIIIVVLSMVGVVLGVSRLLRAMMTRQRLHPTVVGVTLVLVQALGAFIAVALFDPVIYDGGRQILFVIPALAALATFGFHFLLEVLRNLPHYETASGVLAGVVVVALIPPMVNQVQLFPYNYSFYNVVAQGAGVNGSWETDYWGSSIREAAEVVAPGDPVTCRSVGDLNFNIASLEPCATLAPYVGDFAVAKDSTLKENHFWVIRSERTLLWNGPVTSDNCEFHSQVTRPLRGEDVSMAWVYQCEDR
jgi:hypothetical protein